MNTTIQKVDLIGDDLVEVTSLVDGKEKITRKFVAGYKQMSAPQQQDIWREIAGIPTSQYRRFKLIDRLKARLTKQRHL